MKYLVVSDIHAHAWTVFGKTGPDGVNTRLRIILDDLLRAAKCLKDAGGTDMIISGDVFHQRGSIDPEVLNPVRDCFDMIKLMGIDILAIPGNHDLKSRDTKALSSAIQNLENDETLAGGAFTIYNEPYHLKCDDDYAFGFVPWCDTKEELLAGLESVQRDAGVTLNKTDVFIHAGIDGVLSGMPGSGLTAADLAAYGFRRVFAGHYHNHKDMGSGVFSIGATTHHNWGDVGTRAGFLMVDTDDPTDVVFHDTMAPKFVDVSGLDEVEMELECKGNYVRFRGPEMTQSDINDLRSQFKAWGACDVSIQVPKAIATTRSATPTKTLSLADSISAFVDDSPITVDKAQVKKRAAEILQEAVAVTDET